MREDNENSSGFLHFLKVCDFYPTRNWKTLGLDYYYYKSALDVVIKLAFHIMHAFCKVKMLFVKSDIEDNQTVEKIMNSIKQHS